MASPTQHLRTCPTRIDGTPMLFAHKVDTQKCQERQRKGYHKCFTCAFNNAYVDKHGLPKPVEETAAVAEAAQVG